jgi:hypothetical protein
MARRAVSYRLETSVDLGLEICWSTIRKPLKEGDFKFR